jgi:hypothetical protein
MLPDLHTTSSKTRAVRASKSTAGWVVAAEAALQGLARRGDEAGRRRGRAGRRPIGRNDEGKNIMPATEDRRLVRLTKICLALPEAVRELSGDHASFKVRKKPFVYFLNNHHGDHIVAVSFKVASGENVKLATLDADRFYLPAYIGPRGWVGLRLDAGKVDWDEVAEFVSDGYRLVAPKRLTALMSAAKRNTV